MSVSWRAAGDELEFTLSAPTEGWLFVGFTRGSGLDGARWIATRVTSAGPEAHERVTNFTWPAPFHRAVENGAVRVIDGRQSPGKTTVRARIKRAGLIDGPLTMHIAFSASDDWGHHSRMRTAVQLDGL